MYKQSKRSYLISPLAAALSTMQPGIEAKGEMASTKYNIGVHLN